MHRSLLVVTGLAREARAARRPGISAICSGGDSRRLTAMMSELEPTAYWGVVSFGIAGGLDPELGPGDLVLGATVLHQDGVWEACVHLNGALRRSFFSRDLRVFEGAVLGADAAVMTPEHKAALRAKSGAVAVDMESHVAARWARTHDLPFSIVRVVSDPAHRALPPIAANALKPNGDVDLVRVLKGLARAPRQIGALASAGRDSRAAFATLTDAGRCLGARPEAYAPVATDDKQLAPA